jgi:1-acyl-sn-glycerol-3-phosphate acyltransferase
MSLPEGRPPFLLSAARWVASSLNSLAHFSLMLALRPFSYHAAWTTYQRWLRVACRIFGITLSLRDDNSGHLGPPPHLYIWLNQSNLAEVLAFRALPKHFLVINVEYAAMPLLGWARVLLSDVVIVRQWKSQAKRGVARAAKRLAAGETWLISVEGARSLDGALQPYKKGPVVMALQSKATIIPMFLHGGREIMPRGDWRLRPGHVEVHLLKAIPTRGLTFDDRNDLLERLQKLADAEFETQASTRVHPRQPRREPRR